MAATARLNVVDSSAWLTYFAEEPGAELFSAAIEDTGHLIVPVVCLYEVFKVVARQRGDGDAIQAVALMQQGRVVDLDPSLALLAAKLGLDYKLPLADSLVYATAVTVAGVVWTQDDDFKGLPDVKFFPRKKRP